MKNAIHNAVLNRLPAYLHFVKSTYPEGKQTVSSATIARALGLGEVQVRKDLASISGAGKPKVGYDRQELIRHLEDALLVHNRVNAVIVGAGKLGRALLAHAGFADYGIDVCAAFDVNKSDGVLPMSKFDEFCPANNVKIGIVTVSENQAQAVCDKMVACGIKAIWNFASDTLSVPDGIIVKNENLASSAAVLAVTLKSVKGD